MTGDSHRQRRTAVTTAATSPMRRLTLHSGNGGMDMDALVSLLVGAVLLATVVAPLLMYFSGRGLTFLQSLRISAVSFAVWAGIMLVFYFTVEPVTGRTVSGILAMCPAGSLMTRLAAREGVTKTGWLGVGAKAVLSLIALSLVAVGVVGAVGGL